jgi:hypothetical protein
MDGWQVIQFCINCNSYLLSNDGDDEKAAWFSGHSVLTLRGSNPDKVKSLSSYLQCHNQLWRPGGSGVLSGRKTAGALS